MPRYNTVINNYASRRSRTRDADGKPVETGYHN